MAAADQAVGDARRHRSDEEVRWWWIRASGGVPLREDCTEEEVGWSGGVGEQMRGREGSTA
jgi:hypothetical protein